jgi:DNA-binding transcriptional LysR family regulator
MPTFVVGVYIKAGKLIQLLPKYALLKCSVYLVFSDRHQMPPKIPAFIKFMVKRRKAFLDDF